MPRRRLRLRNLSRTGDWGVWPWDRCRSAAWTTAHSSSETWRRQSRSIATCWGLPKSGGLTLGSTVAGKARWRWRAAGLGLGLWVGLRFQPACLQSESPTTATACRPQALAGRHRNPPARGAAGAAALSYRPPRRPHLVRGEPVPHGHAAGPRPCRRGLPGWPGQAAAQEPVLTTLPAVAALRPTTWKL